MFVNLFSRPFEIQQIEADGRVAALLGQHEKAAERFAAAAQAYWRRMEYAQVFRTILEACTQLRHAGMEPEVVEGAVAVSKMFVFARRPVEAVAMADYYMHLERTDPIAFRGGEKFREFIGQLCVQKKLL